MKSRIGKKTAILQVLVSVLIVLGSAQVGQAVNITVKNNCGYQIALGVYPPVWGNGGGFLGAGASVTFGQWASGNGGRVWSRHNCVANGSGPDLCSSGQCGGSGIACAGSTAAGVTEAEINFNASGTDWYDISYVDGFNDMASIAPGNGGYSASCTSKPACTTVVSNGYGGSGDTCLSPCTAFNTDQYCCRNAYGTSASCNESAWPAPGANYVNGIHAVCNGEYTYAYDDSIGLHTTPTGSNYNVVFCPNGGGTAGSTSSSSSTTSSSSTSGGTLAAGVHPIAPGNAPGSRLDDTNGGTANGTGQQIWAAASTSNQNWNWASVGTNTWNAAVNGPYCLDDNGGANGVQTVVWACNGGNNQKWVSAAVSGGYNLAAFGKSECLDVAGNGTANGTKVDVWTCNGQSNQTWIVH